MFYFSESETIGHGCHLYPFTFQIPAQYVLSKHVQFISVNDFYLLSIGCTVDNPTAVVDVLLNLNLLYEKYTFNFLNFFI